MACKWVIPKKSVGVPSYEYLCKLDKGCLSYTLTKPLIIVEDINIFETNVYLLILKFFISFLIAGSCQAVADIVFVVDSSGSIKDADQPGFRNWEDGILTFLTKFVQNIDIGPDAIQIGMVVFSNNAMIHFNLGMYTDEADLVRQIEAAAYIEGTTNTADGIRVMRTQLFSTQFDRYCIQVQVIHIHITMNPWGWGTPGNSDKCHS